MSNDDIRRGLVALRVAFDDADHITRDLFRRRRKRELGPVLQKRNYREAKETVLHTLAALMQLVEGPPDPKAH